MRIISTIIGFVAIGMLAVLVYSRDVQRTRLQSQLADSEATAADLREQLDEADATISRLQANAKASEVITKTKRESEHQVREPERVEWFCGDDSFEAASAKAQQLGRPLFVDFAPDWCVPCQRIKTAVLAKQQVSSTLKTRYVPLIVADGALAEQHRVTSFPRCVVMSTDGTRSKSFTPEESPEAFLRQLAEATSSIQESR